MNFLFVFLFVGTWLEIVAGRNLSTSSEFWWVFLEAFGFHWLLICRALNFGILDAAWRFGI